MKEKYIIISRYEHNGPDGVEFTKWFVLDSRAHEKDEALERIKNIKNDFGFIDKKSKLKHEYDILAYDEYIKNQNIEKQLINEAKKKQDEYFHSDKYKELQKKKRIATKELKEKQKKYKEEHNL